MKKALMIGLGVLAGASALPGLAEAIEVAPRGPAELYTCARGAVSRVAMQAEPAPCCTGLLGCPQLLANTGLVRPARPNRT